MGIEEDPISIGIIRKGAGCGRPSEQGPNNLSPKQRIAPEQLQWFREQVLAVLRNATQPMSNDQILKAIPDIDINESNKNATKISLRFLLASEQVRKKEKSVKINIGGSSTITKMVSGYVATNNATINQSQQDE